MAEGPGRQERMCARAGRKSSSVLTGKKKEPGGIQNVGQKVDGFSILSSAARPSP